MTTSAETQDDGADEDFTCSCCYEILLDPTTLACGHTFCRYCLANWWNTSRKAECLQCRRPFHEFPNVNFTLRFVYKDGLVNIVANSLKIQQSALHI